MGNTQAPVGNSRSNTETGGQNITENAKTDRSEEDEQEDSGLDLDNDTDLSRLFDADNVHFIASSLREAKTTIYERCYQELKEGLENMENRTDIQTINFSRFSEMLKSLALSDDDLMQVFNLLDYEGRGSFETVPVLQALKKNKKITQNDDLNSVLKVFEDCSWMPGFLDVYIDQKDGFKQHGSSILDYLLRNRLSGSSVNCRANELFEGACKLREKIVNSRIKSLEFPSHEDGPGVQSTPSAKTHTKPVLKKENSVSGDDLLPVESKKQELQQDNLNAGEALILWYIQLINSTARACLPLAPELLNTALTHTRTMVNRLLPLSLCHDSEERPTFLSEDCFREMGSLIQLFSEQGELLGQSLSFHLACGGMSEILHCLTELNASTVQIDCSHLLSNIDQVRRRLVKKNTRCLKVHLFDCDAEGNQNPSTILDTNWKQSAYSTKPGKTAVYFVFECSEWTQITKIRIKVGSEKAAPSRGVIYVLAHWDVDADFNAKKELERFSQNANCPESDNESQSLKRLIWGSHATDDPVAYFSTKEKDEVDVVLDHPATGKFILVHFLEPRETDVDHLEIVGIKFYGVQITTGLCLLEQQMSHHLSIAAKPMDANQKAIQAVLRFLLLVFSSQAKTKQALHKGSYHFSRQTHVVFDTKTGIVTYDPPSLNSDRVSTLMAKMPFSKDYPYFEIEIVNRGDRGAISVGAAPKNLQTERHPGWEPQSYGYHADDGYMFVEGSAQSGKPPKPCAVGDKMGCGVEFEGNRIATVYFTKNGERVHEYPSVAATPPNGLFPTVGMHHFGEKARLIGKEPWRFNDVPVKKGNTLAAPGSDFINPSHLDLSNVSIETLWKTYKKFSDKMDRSLSLQLIHSLLPHLKPGSNFTQNASEIFDHLCVLSDHKNGIDEGGDMIGNSAEDVIRDGLDLFFPSKEARPKMLLDLLQESSESSLTGSKLVLFQSLCHYFSTADLDILMPLPSKPSDLPEDFNSSNLFPIMGKLLSLSFQDSLGLFKLSPETDGATTVRYSASVCDETLSGRKKSEHLFYLSKLLNQLQVRLFAWISQELSTPREGTDDLERLEKLIIHYCCQLITPRVEQFLTRMKMLKDSDLKVLILELDTSCLATTLRELVLMLLELATKLSSAHKAKLLENLKPVMMTIRKLLFKLPKLSPSLDENKRENQMEKELRTWEVDSPLTKRTNRVNLTFTFAGATHFEVEFDKRCETEDLYEYLDFGDKSGFHRYFSGQVGRSTWPMKVRFEDTSFINFAYCNDVGEPTSAGYNFKVKALQTKVSDFHWLYDLYLSFCRLFGRISASVLDKTPVVPNSTTSQDKLELQMYRSELWTTIFRVGLVAKKFERSLSGNYETADQSDVASFLIAVSEFKSEKAKSFISRCKGHRSNNIGGEEIDQTIASVFAALLWHTQSLRHDVNIYLRNEFDGKISDGIHDAYGAAESLRLFLAEKRQTMRKELEEWNESLEAAGEKRKEIPVDVVHLVEEKSKFLLQFAGLSRVALRAEEMKRKFESRRSRQQSIGHRLSHESSIDLSISVESKYPSFRLVFAFVQDIAWTKEKVEELLKKRYVNSESLWKTYSFMNEFFRTISSEPLDNDMSSVVFIRELLASQHKFGRHYADGIDGCGLGMESNVRSSYYGLLRLLVTLLRKDVTTSDKSKPVGYEVLTTCVLHLLDIDWQAYDLPFVVELRLPELYFTLAKDHLPQVIDEQEEVGIDETEEQYRQNLVWATEIRTTGNFASGRNSGTGQLSFRQIRARFHKTGMSTSFQCDACRQSVSMNYYRCLDCNDVDVCQKCFKSEIIPESESHNGEHTLVPFKYLCKGCKGFIIATRWHCNECNDYDLCNGCHNCNHFPEDTSHTADHNVSKFPTPRVHQSKTVMVKDPMNAYFHVHSWMLFSTTALSTLDFLLSKASDEKLQRMDENYVYSARQLYNSCLETAVDCLVQKLSTDEVDSDQSITSSGETQSPAPEASAAIQRTSSTKASEAKDGSLVSKVIGLIAALIPPNNQNPVVKEVTEILSSETFLMALFDIARAKKVHDVMTRHMALGLLGKLLQQMNVSSEASQSVKSSESGEVMIVDPKAVNLVQSLFDFGADCLKSHGLELAKSTSQVLNGLQTNPTWTQLLAHQFCLTVDLQHSNPTLSSIFALFAFTGFPEMLTVGTLVTHVEKDKEVVRSVVQSKRSDEAMCTIIELTSRKKKRVKDTLLDVVVNNKSFLTESQISQFLKLIIDIVNHKVIPGLPLDVQSLWQLSLVIKASLQTVLNSQSKVNVQLYENSFLQSLSHLAALGTRLSKSLLLRDIEILSLELNKHSQTEPSLTAEPDAVATTTVEDTAADNNDHSGEDGDNDVASSSDEDDGEWEIAAPEAYVPVSGTGEEAAAEESVVDTTHRDAEPAKKKKRHQTTEKSGETDIGVGIGRYISDLLHAEIDIDECTEESDPEKPCLFPNEGEDDKEIVRKRKEKSSGLAEKLLSSKEKGLLTKVNRALAILYARKLLMALVSECSEDKAAEFFAAGGPSDCRHITNIFFILPLLSGLETEKTLEKVIRKVINCCQPDDIVSIAIASSFFVAATEGQVVTVSKQLPPSLPLKSDGDKTESTTCNFLDEVYIPGATALKVELDKSSSAECDVEIVFSSSSDLTKNRQCFSGRSSENWEDFTIKGDHLYCALTGPEVTKVSSSYQFKVTGIVSFADQFHVGFLALSAIFDKPETARSLPFGRMWKLLVGKVNRSAKAQRLKAIRLLIKLLSLQTKSRGCEEMSVDLSLLKGLWRMYQNMMEATKESTEVQPALVLALTELFYVAQIVAKEWNAVHCFVTSVEADGSTSQE